MLWKREGHGVSLTHADILNMEFSEISEWAEMLTKAWDQVSGGQPT